MAERRLHLSLAVHLTVLRRHSPATDVNAFLHALLSLWLCGQNWNWLHPIGYLKLPWAYASPLDTALHGYFDMAAGEIKNWGLTSTFPKTNQALPRAPYKHTWSVVFQKSTRFVFLSRDLVVLWKSSEDWFKQGRKPKFCQWRVAYSDISGCITSFPLLLPQMSFLFFFFFNCFYFFFYYITGLTESIVPCSSQHSQDQSHETAVLAAVCDTYSYVTGSGRGHFTDRFLVRQPEMLWWWLRYYGYMKPITTVWIWNAALAFGLDCLTLCCSTTIPLQQ